MEIQNQNLLKKVNILWAVVFCVMAFTACHTSSVVVSKKKHKKGTHEPWGLNTEVKAKPVDTIEYAPKHIKEILSHQDSFKTKPIYKVALILPFQLDSFYKDKKND